MKKHCEPTQQNLLGIPRKKYTFDDDFGGSYTFDDSESQPTLLMIPPYRD
eukprot:COSAG01_NODE_49813_length_368_cov_76.550186_2_plen_49_part_01